MVQYGQNWSTYTSQFYFFKHLFEEVKVMQMVLSHGELQTSTFNRDISHLRRFNFPTPVSISGWGIEVLKFTGNPIES